MQAFWMLLASFMFSIMVLCIKLAASTQTVGLGEIVFMRGIISAVVLYTWAVVTQPKVFPDYWTPHIIRNCAGSSAMWLSFYATTLLPISISTALNYTSPLFLAVWTICFVTISNRKMHCIPIFLGFFGVLAILQPTIANNQWFAAVIALISSILSTVAYLQIRQMGQQGESSWRIVMLFSIVVTLTGLIAIPFQAHNFLDYPFSWQTFAYLLGIGSTGLIAQLAMTRALSKGSTTLASSLQYSTIIFALIWGVLFWDETTDILKWIGILMIILGGILSTWLTKRSS